MTNQSLWKNHMSLPSQTLRISELQSTATKATPPSEIRTETVPHLRRPQKHRLCIVLNQEGSVKVRLIFVSPFLNLFSRNHFPSLFHLILRRPAVLRIHLQDPGLQLTANGHRPWSGCKTLVGRPRRSKMTMSNCCRIVYSNVVNSLEVSILP